MREASRAAFDERDHQPAEQPAAAAAAEGPQIVDALDELDYQQARGTKAPSLAAAAAAGTASSAPSPAVAAARNFTAICDV